MRIVERCLFCNDLFVEEKENIEYKIPICNICRMVIEDGDSSEKQEKI